MLNIYRASAGSGKTYRLTQDYIQLLFDPKRDRVYRRILAVTFTNKATEEMKARILKELHALSMGEKSDYRDNLMKKFRMSEDAVNTKAKKLLTNILHDFSSFSISTIDKFFQQVIRSFARDIGVHGGYNLELDNSSTLEQSVDNLFLDLSKEENKQLLHWLTAYAEERIEQSESWNMRKNILDLGQEIFKESYQHKAEDTNRKLHEREFLSNYRKNLREIKNAFETELKKTATEGLNLMSKNNLTHDDFAYKTTNTLEKLQKGKLEVSNRFVSFAEDLTNCYTKSKPQNIKDTIELAYNNGLQKCFLQIVELLKVNIVNYNSAVMVLKHINTLGILSDLAVQIKKLTDEQNTMLISDSNMLLNKIIDNSDTPFVYEKTGIHIDNYMIDEFQDTSVLQWINFKPLMENSLSAGKENLVVGDVKQSIYRWRNSDWKLLDEKILSEFRPEQIHEENLDTNWRSDKNVIDFNNSFFLRASKLLQQKLNENLTDILPVYPHLEVLTTKIEHAYSNIYQKTSPKAGIGHVKFSFIVQDENEEGWKAESMNRLPEILENLQTQGYRPNDIAILVRDRKDARLVINELLNYKTSEKAKEEFCYDALGNEGLLINDAGSVRFLIGIMKLFINPSDSIQQTIVNYEYARGKQKKSENEALNACFAENNNVEHRISALFSVDENATLKQLQNKSLFDMVEKIISLFDIGNWYNEAVFVQAFQDVVYSYTTSKTVDINSFLNWWEIVSAKKYIATPDSQNSMRIMTIHKSKGLEFKAVVIPFCDWELDQKKGNIKNYLWCEPKIAPFNELPLLPIEYSSTLEKSIFSEDYFDEKMHRFIDNLNLAYVGFTRAENELICLAPAPKKEVESLDKMNSLSTLLTSCFTNESFELDSDIISLSAQFNKEKNSFEIGNPTEAIYKEVENKEINEKINNYPSVSSTDRLHIRHQSLDYLLNNQELTDSRLNYGLIMHDILKQINRKSDQGNAIAAMIREGRINEDEGIIVAEEMEKFWDLPETVNWFTDDLKVLNETTILTPTGEQYRPDRVIIKNNKATIVDYKFGEKESENYQKQVQQYMQLIAEMGYQTEGYLCYVSLGKVEKVV
ncbi:MAG: UvrD-helicase domain-containing protein [Paludibacter sp.]|nr:UvrD-helicase domain-containing protein [Paludibacter sp.]